MLQGGLQSERRASWAAIEPQIAREHNLRVEWIKVLHAGRQRQRAIPWQVPPCTSRQHKHTTYPACYSTQATAAAAPGPWSCRCCTGARCAATGSADHCVEAQVRVGQDVGTAHACIPGNCNRNPGLVICTRGSAVLSPPPRSQVKVLRIGRRRSTLGLHWWPCCTSWGWRDMLVHASSRPA
jgi:hypothetical protein